jgi:DNA-binding transcriptional LysR family regulator
MPRTNLNDIQLFVAVVDAGSFAAGAQTMSLSRSAAGKAIARLEERLGARLFNRTTRALSLTDEGPKFYERGQQILDAVEEAEETIAGPGATPRAASCG